MHSLADLNQHSQTSLPYTNIRSPGVYFDNIEPIDQYIPLNAGSTTHMLLNGINITDISSPETMNVYYDVDVSALSGATVFWPSIPVGATQSEISPGIFRLSYINTAEEWEQVKNPTINHPGIEEDDNIVYSAYIKYEPNKEKGWDIYITVLYGSDMIVTSDMGVLASLVTKSKSDYSVWTDLAALGGILYDGQSAYTAAITMAIQLTVMGTASYNSSAILSATGVTLPLVLTQTGTISTNFGKSPHGFFQYLSGGNQYYASYTLVGGNIYVGRVNSTTGHLQIYNAGGGNLIHEITVPSRSSPKYVGQFTYVDSNYIAILSSYTGSSMVDLYNTSTYALIRSFEIDPSNTLMYSKGDSSGVYTSFFGDNKSGNLFYGHVKKHDYNGNLIYELDLTQEQKDDGFVFYGDLLAVNSQYIFVGYFNSSTLAYNIDQYNKTTGTLVKTINVTGFTTPASSYNTIKRSMSVNETHILMGIVDKGAILININDPLIYQTKFESGMTDYAQEVCLTEDYAFIGTKSTLTVGKVTIHPATQLSTTLKTVERAGNNQYALTINANDNAGMWMATDSTVIILYSYDF